MYANKLTSFAATAAATDKTWTTVQKKYVAPSKRNSSPYGNNNNNNNNNKSTDKKELKKRTQLDINNTAAFPTLGNNKTTKSTVMSFSAAAATSQTKEVKLNDASADKEEILPGWVYIRKNNKKIQYKYGEVVYDVKKEEREGRQLSNVLFKYRIEREQYERDMDVVRLGDLSEFYNLPTLTELYNSDDLLCNNEDNNSDNER